MGQKYRQKKKSINAAGTFTPASYLYFAAKILPSKRNFNRVYFGNGISSNCKILQLGYLNNYLQYVKRWNYSEKEKNIPSTNT